MKLRKVRKTAITLITLLAIGGGGVWGWSTLRPSPVQVLTPSTTAVIGEVRSTVSASGKVISPGDIGVSPTISGVITAIYVKVGDHVSAGQILAKLDTSALRNSLDQARTSLSYAKNALTKLVPVRTAAEQVQMDMRLLQSKKAIDIAIENLANIQSTTVPSSAIDQSAVSVAKRRLKDAQAMLDLNASLYQADTNAAKAALDFAQSSYDTYLRTWGYRWGKYGFTISRCQYPLVGFEESLIQDFFNQCSIISSNADAITSAKLKYSAAQLSQTTKLKKDSQNVEALQAAYDQEVARYNQVLAAQTSNAAKDALLHAQAIQAAKNSVDAAQLSYDLLKQQYEISMQGPSQIDLNVASASVSLARSNYRLAVINLAAATVRAPVAGDVASISGIVGAVAPTSATSATTGTASGFIVLTNVSALQIQAGFSESDTAKIKKGQFASFDFAALPNVRSFGKVAQIGLLPSTTTGATSYLVTLYISTPVKGLKPSMTTTVTVTTDLVKNVLQVNPATLTYGDNNRATVNVVTKVNGQTRLVPTVVVTGLQGDTSVEIVSGIKPGTKLALPTYSSAIDSGGFPTVGVPTATNGGGFLNGDGNGNN